MHSSANELLTTFTPVKSRTTRSFCSINGSRLSRTRCPKGRVPKFSPYCIKLNVTIIQGQAAAKFRKFDGKSSPLGPKTTESSTSGKEGAEAHQHQVHFCRKYVPDPLRQNLCIPLSMFGILAICLHQMSFRPNEVSGGIFLKMSRLRST